MKVLILDRYTEKSIALLKSSGFLVSTFSGSKLPKDQLAETEALLIRSNTIVTEELIKKMSNLKVVVSATSGFDHIDWRACKNNNIAAFYTPEANAQSAAEHALLLTLGCLKNFSQVQKLNVQGLWKDQLSVGSELAHKKVGIIGFGRVGQAYAKLVKAFACDVQFYDPYKSDDVAKEMQVTKTDITELLKTSDIVSLHVPLTKNTKNLMHNNNLNEMNADAILINTSRGEVVCENSLINALSEGHIKAAGLDVFAHEPLSKDSKLRSMPNALISPHMGALTEEALHRASLLAAETLMAFQAGENLNQALPLGVDWLE